MLASFPRWFFRLFLLLTIGASTPVFAAATTSTLPSGTYHSLASDSTGSLRAAYVRSGSIYQAHWNGTAWNETLVMALPATDISLAVDSDNVSHIAAASIAGAVYIKQSGASWVVSNLGTQKAQHISLALKSNGEPLIAFSDTGLGKVRLARWTAPVWTLENVDPATGSKVGRFVRLRIGVEDKLHLAYASVSGTGTTTYRHATKTGNDPWQFSTVADTGVVESTTSSDLKFCDLTLINRTTPRIIYFHPAPSASTVKIADLLGSDDWIIRNVVNLTTQTTASVAIDGTSYPTPIAYTKTSAIEVGYYGDTSFTLFSGAPAQGPRRANAVRTASGAAYWSYYAGSQRLLGSAPLVPGAGAPISDAEAIRIEVRKNLNLPPGSPITQADWDRLLTFTLKDRGLTDVSEVRFARNLTNLELSGNNITDLAPLSSLTSLQSLHLSGNRVTDPRPLLKLSQLYLVDLSGNCLDLEHDAQGWISRLRQHASVSTPEQSSIWNRIDPALATAIRASLGLPANVPFAFYHHSQLTSLYAFDKGIQDLTGLNQAVNLETLTLTENLISDLNPLRGLTKLTTLSIGQNSSNTVGVTDLSPIKDLPALTELAINGHRLTDIRWLLSSSVQYVSLGNNGLTTDPDSEDARVISQLRPAVTVTGDTQQRCSWNWVLDPALDAKLRLTLGLSPTALFTSTHVQRLNSLNASGLGIKSLAGLDQATLLQSLTVNENEIEDLSPVAFLPHLSQIQASQNRLTDLSALLNLPSLQTLEVAGNYLDTENGSPVAGQIAKLLQNNVQVSWGGQKCPWNVELDPCLAQDIRTQLAMSNQAEFTHEHCAQLHQISSKTGVRSLRGLERAVNLTNIEIRNHLIEDLSPLATLPALENLDLGNGKREFFPLLPRLDLSPLANLTRLRSLNLRNHRVGTVEPILLLPALETVELDGNYLAEDEDALLALQSRGVTGSWYEQYCSWNVLPDPVLAHALRSSLGLQPWDEFQPFHIPQVTHLYAHPGVRSLEGLQHATNLVLLDITDHQAVDLTPVAGLLELQSLLAPRQAPFVEGNPAGFSDLSPLADLANLRELDLYNNRVLDPTPLLHLKAMGNLETASLRDNFIDAREGSEGEQQLLWLNASREQRCPWLITMDPALYDAIRFGLGIDSRDLTQREMDEVTHVQAYDFEISSLNGLELAHNLRSLSVSHGNVRDLSPLRDLTKLHDLNLNDNRVSDLEPLRSHPLLEHLDLSGNEVTKIQVLTTIPSLQYVNLSRNGLHAAHPDGEDAGVTLALRSRGIQVLDDFQRSSWNWILDPNLAAKLKSDLGRSESAQFQIEDYLLVNSIQAEDLNIQHLEGLEEAAGLQAINFKGNRIRSAAPLAGLPLLDFVDLSHQAPGLTDVSPFATLPELRHLNLARNHVTDISALLSTVNLQDLNIGENGLDPSEGSDDYLNVEALRARGVQVNWYDQLSPANWELDPGLLLLVRREFGLFQPHQEIQYERMAGLEHLEYSDWPGIASLKGLQYAVNLKSLSLGKGAITDLSPLSGFAHLTHLSLAGHEIANLDVLLTMSNLEMVQVQRNHIDISENSPASQVLEELTRRGVGVSVYPQRIAIGKLKQQVHFSFESDTIPLPESPLPLSAYADSDLPITFDLLQGDGQIADSALQMNKPGLFVVRARQAGSGVYRSAEIIRQLTVTKRSQSIDFAPISISSYQPEDILLTASTPSDLPIIFSVFSGPAQIEDNRLRLTAAGTIVLQASQAGNDLYFPTTAEQTIEIGKLSQSLTFTPAANQQVPADGRITLAATSNAAVPITYEILSGNGSIDGSSLIPTRSGPFRIRATQAATPIYNEATVEASFTVLKRSQVITFDSVSMVYRATPVTLSAQSNELLPVTFAVLNGPGLIDGNELTILQAGTVVVRASNGGNSLVLPAHADATFEIGKLPQTLNVSLPGTLEFSRQSFRLNGASSQNLPVAWSIVSGPAKVSGNQLTMLGLGSIRIRATQPGNAHTSAASPVDRVIQVKDTIRPGISCPSRFATLGKSITIAGSLIDNHQVDYLEYRVTPPQKKAGRWIKLNIPTPGETFRLRMPLSAEGTHLVEIQATDHAGNKSSVRKVRVIRK